MTDKLEKIFSLNISIDMDSALSERARQDGVSRGEVVRVALAAYLANGNPMGQAGMSDEDIDRVASKLAEKLSSIGQPMGRPAPESTPAPVERKRRTTAVRAKLPAPVEDDETKPATQPETQVIGGVEFTGNSARLSRLMARVEASTQDGTD